MDLKELGRLLQGQREALGHSIEELSDKTRISRRILVIFESGDVENYPHPVYAKGFIRNYAKTLGLDEDMCIRALEKELGPQEEVEEDGEHKLTLNDLEEAAPAVKTGSPWLVFLGSAVLVAILAGLVWYISFSDMPTAQGQQGSSEQSAVVEQSDVASQTTESEQDKAESAPAVEDEDQQQQTRLDVEGTAEDQPLAVQASAGQAGQQTAQPVTKPASQSGLHSLSIEVVGKEPCWVGVWIPGQDAIAKDFTVPVGETVEYRFSGERILRFGRIEAVRLTFDGKSRPVKGKGVVNLTLP